MYVTADYRREWMCEREWVGHLLSMRRMKGQKLNLCVRTSEASVDMRHSKERICARSVSLGGAELLP